MTSSRAAWIAHPIRVGCRRTSCAMTDKLGGRGYPSSVMAQLDCAIPLLEAGRTTRRFGFCYMMASGYHGTIYLGMTSDLSVRVAEHKSKSDPKSFTARYDCNRLVWFERYDLVTDAIAREKQIKHWNRAWKVELIETLNPHWEDLPLDWTIYEK